MSCPWWKVGQGHLFRVVADRLLKEIVIAIGFLWIQDKILNYVHYFGPFVFSYQAGLDIDSEVIVDKNIDV